MRDKWKILKEKISEQLLECDSDDSLKEYKICYLSVLNMMNAIDEHDEDSYFKCDGTWVRGKGKEIVITNAIVNYINQNKTSFNDMKKFPNAGEVWKIDRITSYPNVLSGEKVIELSNNDGRWMRIPFEILTKNE